MMIIERNSMLFCLDYIHESRWQYSELQEAVEKLKVKNILSSNRTATRSGVELVAVDCHGLNSKIELV